MAGMSDEIEVLIVPNLKTSGVEKQTKEIAKMFENNIGKPLDTSLEKYFKNINGQLVTFVKTGNKYKRLALDVDKKKNITGVSGLSGSYSKAEAQKLLKQEVRQEEVRLKEIEAVRKKKEKEKTNKKAIARGKEFSEIIGSTLTGSERIRFDISREQENLKNLQKQFEGVNKGTKKYEKLKEQIKSTQQNINNLNKDLKKSNKIGGFEKLFNTFKRVGFYRLARRLFQVIEQGIGKGIQGLVEFDNQANKTMSAISLASDKISGSFAMMVLPLIQIAEPFITSFSNTIANFANSISMASAEMQGFTKYTRINKDAVKDLQTEMNSMTASFDKFESLNGKTSIYEQAIITPEDKESMEKGKEFLQIMQKIGGSLKQILDKIFEVIKNIFRELEPYIEPITDFVLLVLDAVGKIIIGLGKLIAKISEVIKTKEQLAKVLEVIGGIVMGIGMLSGNFGMIFGGSAIMLGGIAIEAKANGGMVDSGSLFVAGEAGAELVTTMPSGQTGVTNIAQFKQAMVEAIYECSDVFQQSGNDVVLNLDGAQIARSKTFKSELNRINSGLNLR